MAVSEANSLAMAASFATSCPASTSLLAQPPVLGKLDVLEEHLGVDDRALAHLLHRRTEGDPSVAALDDERRHSARARPRRDRREDDVILREPAVGDPRLLA